MSETPDRQSLYPQTHRTGNWDAPVPPKRSRGLWFLTIALVGIGLSMLAVNLGIEHGRDQGSKAPIITSREGQEINAIQAEPGVCLSDLPEDGDVSTVTALPCSVEHRAEVVTSYVFEGDWPGSAQVQADALSFCGGFIQPGFEAGAMFQPGDWDAGLRWVAWVPTEDSWSAGEKEAVCIVYRDADLRGSFVHGTAVFVD